MLGKMGGILVSCALAQAVGVSGYAQQGPSAADAAWAAKRAAAVNRPRPLVYNTDGCDMLYWPSNLPVSVGNFTGRRLAYAPGTFISTVSYCPQSAGFGHFTCRRAGEPSTGTVPYPTGGHYNAATAFFKLGTDSLQMASEYCATNGLECFVSVRVNDQHDSVSTPGRLSALYPPFKIAHPECLMGALDPQSPRRKELYKGYAGWSCVNFDEELVRTRMKTFVRELVTNYDVDGIEYDFNRHFMLFRSVATGGVARVEEIAKMTALMRDLKAITEEVGRRKNRPIVIAMRSPDSVDYNRAAGVDLETWFREKLVDIWIGGGYFLLNPPDVSVRLAHRHGVKFYWSLDETRIPGLARKKGNPFIPGRMTPAFYAGRYSAAQAAGCDGVYLFNIENGSLRKMASMNPKDVARERKLYFAMDRGSGGYSPDSWVRDGRRFGNMPQIDPNRPLDLKAGRPFAFTMFLGDDFAQPASVTVQVLVDRVQTLDLRVNGHDVGPLHSQKDLFTVAVPSAFLQKGMNAFSLLVSSDARLRDFAIEVPQRVRK